MNGLTEPSSALANGVAAPNNAAAVRAVNTALYRDFTISNLTPSQNASVRLGTGSDGLTPVRIRESLLVEYATFS